MTRGECRGAMVVRWRRRVVVTVASGSLALVVLLVCQGRILLSSILCPDSNQSDQTVIRQTTEQSSRDVSRQRIALSFDNSSQRDDFQRDVVRPRDSLPTVAVATATTNTTTTTESRLPRRQFVLHRCPSSYHITDPQDEWFRTVVVQRSPPTSQVTFTDEILILTPICNAERNLRRYFENLCSLAYPHRLISVVLGEDSSSDHTVQLATELINDLGSFFKRLQLVRLPGRTPHKTDNDRHDAAWQLNRRRNIALARNRLLSAALGLIADQNVNWVVWLDVDIRHIPRDLIRYLLSANQSVVVPNCLWRMDNGQTATFDRNTWRETKASLSQVNSLPQDALMIEGYSHSKRRFLNDLKTESDVVRVDGVGGCVLLVAADLHRSGLVFPPFVFDHHIETEGMAKMAARMGVKLYGLPSVNIIHA